MMLGVLRQILGHGTVVFPFLRQDVERVGLVTSITGKNYSTATKELRVHDALNSALDEEMTIDPKVYIMGEKVGNHQGAYKISRGLLEKHGLIRVLHIPITEAEFSRIDIGMTGYGLRPVVEFMTYDFSWKAIAHFINSPKKSNYMSDGELSFPIVFRGPNKVLPRVGDRYSQAAQILSRDGISAEIINLRSICPLDRDAIIASVKKTNRLVTVEEGFAHFGIGAQTCEVVYEECYQSLNAPVEQITGAKDVPQVEDIVRAAKRAINS